MKLKAVIISYYADASDGSTFLTKLILRIRDASTKTLKTLLH